MKRRKLTKRGNKRLFRRTASKVHKMNLVGKNSRGGIRL